MVSLIPDELAVYVHDHTTPERELFTRLRDATFASLEDPQMQVGRVEGAFLRLIVQISHARRVLEIGTYSGYSALSMASGLPDDGRLITCDIDPVATDLARKFIEESPWSDKIELRLGPARETLRHLVEEGGEFDLVFLDADKESYADYFEAVLPMVAPGGVILADNTLWSGAVLDPQGDSDHGIVDFNARVRDDPRVEQVLLSVRDGITLCRKIP
jgi:predicted O-methyltransferase YrrM